MAFQGGVFAVRRPIVVKQLASVADAVKDRRLEAAVAKQKCSVLRVDVDNRRAELFQECHGHRGVVGKASRFAIGQYLAADYQGPVVGIVDIVLVKKRFEVELLNVENGLDHTFAPGVVQGFRVCPLPQQQ